jgi:hypothetical protein
MVPRTGFGKLEGKIFSKICELYSLSQSPATAVQEPIPSSQCCELVRKADEQTNYSHDQHGK